MRARWVVLWVVAVAVLATVAAYLGTALVVLALVVEPARVIDHVLSSATHVAAP